MSIEIDSGESIWRRLRILSNSLLNAVLPPVCAGCGKVGQLFCDSCLSQVEWVRSPVCYWCGKPLASSTFSCSGCRSHRLSTGQIRSATLHVNPVKRVLHLMKYEGYFALADPLGELMIKAWPRWGLSADLVVPIPLHAERKRQRGYNQAELLVKVIKRSLDWDSVPGALLRHRRTIPQVGLNVKERQQNVRGAFSADSAIVSGRNVLLVDDVCTTGSTLDAAARVLLDAGATAVDAFCLTTVAGSKPISIV